MTNKNKIQCKNCIYGKHLDCGGVCNHPQAKVSFQLSEQQWNQGGCAYGKPKNQKNTVYVVIGRSSEGTIIMTNSFFRRQDAIQYIQDRKGKYELDYFQIKEVEFSQPIKSKKVYNIGFMNPETKLTDETQFDVDNFEELLELFKDFSKENHFEKDPTIMYVEFVGLRQED